MFSIMELRLIRYSISKEITQDKKKLKILDPDSDDSMEIGNDLMILRNILEKISENSDI